MGVPGGDDVGGEGGHACLSLKAGVQEVEDGDFGAGVGEVRETEDGGEEAGDVDCGGGDGFGVRNGF